MVKRIVLTVAVMALSACTTVREAGRSDGIVRINPASLAADPARWDGRQVEIVGLLVWESDRLGLYQSYGAYCRGAENAAIHVDWRSWPGTTKADNRRQVMVRGIFRNRPAVAQGGAPTIVSTGTPGPGPLEPGYVLSWLSKPFKPCPPARP
jgi:hypothetical protein